MTFFLPSLSESFLFSRPFLSRIFWYWGESLLAHKPLVMLKDLSSVVLLAVELAFQATEG